MKTFIRFIVAVVFIVAFIIMFLIARNFSYVEEVEISICKKEDKCEIVEAYRFETNEIRKMFALTNIYANHRIDKKFKCTYKMVINEKDILCYDGGKYGLFKQRIDTIEDIKEKVKEKDIGATSEDQYKEKIIVMNRQLANFLIDLGEE